MSDGLFHHCIKCQSDYKKQYYQENKAEVCKRNQYNYHKRKYNKLDIIAELVEVDSVKVKLIIEMWTGRRI